MTLRSGMNRWGPPFETGCALRESFHSTYNGKTNSKVND